MVKEWLRGRSIIVICELESFSKYLIYDLLVKYNCKILCICTNIKKSEIFKEKVIEYQERINFENFDITNESAWQTFVNKLNSNNKRFDVVIDVNNSCEDCLFDELMYKDYEESITKTFYKTVLSLKYLLPIIQESRNASVITVIDINYTLSKVGFSHHNSSVMAVKSFVETISDEKTDVYFGLMYTTCVCKSTKELNANYIKTSKNIIKAINKKKKKVYIPQKIAVIRCLHSITPKFIKKLLHK